MQISYVDVDVDNKSSEVCIKTPPAWLPFKGQVTEQTIWSIFAATKSHLRIRQDFASFVYPLRLALSRSEIYAFIDCFLLLRISDRQGDFACASVAFPHLNPTANRKRMFRTFRRCPALTSSGTEVDGRGITDEFNHC